MPAPLRRLVAPAFLLGAVVIGACSHVSAGDPDVCGPVPLATGATCEYIGPPCMINAKCENGTCVPLSHRGDLSQGCDQGADCKSGVCDADTKLCVLP